MPRLDLLYRCLKSHLRLAKRYAWDPWRLWLRFPETEFEAGATASRSCRFGEGVRVHAQCVLDATEVGRYSYIATGTHLRHCRIGAFCSIGPWVRAGLGRHPARDYVSTHPAFFSTAGQSQGCFVAEGRFEEAAPICVGNDVWVGAGALLLDGVTIGDGAIVGGGAVVAEDVAPYMIVGGVPCRPIRARFDPDEIRFLRELQWWNREASWLRRYAPLFDDVKRLRQALS